MPAVFVSAARSNTLAKESSGGADRDRTGDPRLAKPVLSQLSYSPEARFAPSPKPAEAAASHESTVDELRSFLVRSSAREAGMVGLGRVELPTSRLSGVRSNHLSYRPPGMAGLLVRAERAPGRFPAARAHRGASTARRPRRNHAETRE